MIKETVKAVAIENTFQEKEFKEGCEAISKTFKSFSKKKGIEMIEETLKEREKDYGTFSDQAFIAQNIKYAFKNESNWDDFNDVQRESLDMLASKLARVLNGNINHYDSWYDMLGYLQLVVNSLHKPTVKFYSKDGDELHPVDSLNERNEE